MCIESILDDRAVEHAVKTDSWQDIKIGRVSTVSPYWRTVSDKRGDPEEYENFVYGR